jgi:hypothetical protein
MNNDINPSHIPATSQKTRSFENAHQTSVQQPAIAVN